MSETSETHGPKTFLRTSGGSEKFAPFSAVHEYGHKSCRMGGGDVLSFRDEPGRRAARERCVWVCRCARGGVRLGTTDKIIFFTHLDHVHLNFPRLWHGDDAECIYDLGFTFRQV